MKILGTNKGNTSAEMFWIVADSFEVEMIKVRFLERTEGKRNYVTVHFPVKCSGMLHMFIQILFRTQP